MCMKPYELYSFVCSINGEVVNHKKLPFFLCRAKKALNNLREHGWGDEQIKVLIINTFNALKSSQRPSSYQYIVGILCNVAKTPTVKSVEDTQEDYTEWIEKEKERLMNAE